MSKSSAILARAATPLQRFWQRLFRNNLLWAGAGMVLGWRIFLELLNQMAGMPGSTFWTNLSNWSLWDGGWYTSIVERGYEFSGSFLKEENIAFFPAYPETINLVTAILPLRAVHTGLLLNIGLTIASIYLVMLLAKWLAKQSGAVNPTRIAILSAAAFLLYPSSFFFAAHYAEAMLVLGTLGATYFALTKRLWWAVPFMVIATASKVIGILSVATVAVIVFEQWRREKKSPLSRLVKQWSVTALGLSGLAAYMLFLWLRFGNPLLFYSIQQAWGRNDGGFFVTDVITNHYVYMFDPLHYGTKYTYLLELLYMALPFVLTAIALYAWRRYKTYWPLVPGILSWLIPASTGVLASVNRYALIASALIPFAIIWLQRWPAFVTYGLLAASGCLMLLFTIAFLRGSPFMG
jgi:hypothetical protein